MGTFKETFKREGIIMKKFIMFCVLMLSISNLAYADEHDEYKFYFGGGIGMSFFDGDADFKNHNEIDINDTTFTAKIFAGYRFHKNVALEIGLHHFGNVDFKETVMVNDKLINKKFNYTARAIDLSVLWIIPPIEGIELFLRTGMLYTGFSGDEIDYFKDKDGLSFILGVGAIIEFNDRFAISPEIQWSPNVLGNNGEGNVEINTYEYVRNRADGPYGIHIKNIKKEMKYNHSPDIDIVSVTMNFIYRF